MFHAPELIVLLALIAFVALLVGLVWLFGLAIGHGIARGKHG